MNPKEQEIPSSPCVSISSTQSQYGSSDESDNKPVKNTQQLKREMILMKKRQQQQRQDQQNKETL
jgi:hypothetical protein